MQRGELLLGLRRQLAAARWLVAGGERAGEGEAGMRRHELAERLLGERLLGELDGARRLSGDERGLGLGGAPGDDQRVGARSCSRATCARWVRVVATNGL